jgi:hypothetical protein
MLTLEAPFARDCGVGLHASVWTCDDFLLRLGKETLFATASNSLTETRCVNSFSSDTNAGDEEIIHSRETAFTTIGNKPPFRSLTAR